jgi:hypothetical protein
MGQQCCSYRPPKEAVFAKKGMKRIVSNVHQFDAHIQKRTKVPSTIGWMPPGKRKEGAWRSTLLHL